MNNTIQCNYVKQGGKKCHREALPSSEKGFCLLHEDWERKDANETAKEFYREIAGGITDFEGCILPEINLSGRVFEDELNFIKATIKGGADFSGGTIERHALFVGATIEGGASFFKAKIGGIALFKRAKIKGNALFIKATIAGPALFDRATIAGDASFIEATIAGNASFIGATIEGEVGFSRSNFNNLTFEKATFALMAAQEEACRTARITQERLGDRVLADNHFYREMEAKRKQKHVHFSLKPILKLIRKLRLEKLISEHVGFLEKERRIYWGFLELPIQYLFGYGVHPWWVLRTILLTVSVFAFGYWIGNGIVIENGLSLWDRLWPSIYFSVVTAATPGYGGYQPQPGLFHLLASAEAIFGTFMWAAFIATFARKYMR